MVRACGSVSGEVSGNGRYVRVCLRRFRSRPWRWPERRTGSRRWPCGVRDELGEVFADEAFIDAFGVRGRPGISPGQLAMVTVLQFAEDLTDRRPPTRSADVSIGNTAWVWR